MRKILAVPVVVAALVVGPVAPVAAASQQTKVIVLPGATSAEGITAGRGTTFYAGDLVGGDIFRGDVRRGTAELFIDAPAGTEAAGMDVDLRHDLLFVAGGPILSGGSGKVYVYNIRTRALVASYELGEPGASLVNDVTVTPDGAWFTDSLQPKLYFVPIVRGVPGPVRTVELTGPAAGDPGADGLILDGRRLWAVEFENRVSRWRLSADLSSGTEDGAISDPQFAEPVTAAKFGDRLAVVNSHLRTGLPPTNPTYEVVVVGA